MSSIAPRVPYFMANPGARDHETSIRDPNGSLPDIPPPPPPPPTPNITSPYFSSPPPMPLKTFAKEKRFRSTKPITNPPKPPIRAPRRIPEVTYLEAKNPYQHGSMTTIAADVHRIGHSAR